VALITLKREEAANAAPVAKTKGANAQTGGATGQAVSNAALAGTGLGTGTAAAVLAALGLAVALGNNGDNNTGTTTTTSGTR
jgi:hypothetical protein